MQTKNWITTPVLPCRAISETLSFWENIGFTTTYRQDRPYQYGVVERGGHQLHFIRIKGVEFSLVGCLIMVQDIQKVHSDFSACMKTQLGKVPLTGIPRISRMRPGQTRFTLTDVSGNPVIFIQIGEKDQSDYDEASRADLSAPQKAIALALRLRDFKEDYVAAAKVLDNELIKLESEIRETERAEALVIRSELARVLGDMDKYAECNLLLSLVEIREEELRQLKEKHCWTD